MILIVLAIGIVIVIAAIRNSHVALGNALLKDVPPYAIWGAAVIAVGSIGFIPGLKPVGRGLLALVILVIVLKNYQNILNGFQNAWKVAPVLSPGTIIPGAGTGPSTGAPNGGNPARVDIGLPQIESVN